MAKILVTGAAGFIGSHTVEHLLRENHSVLGIDNFRTGREENIKQIFTHPGFTLVREDITVDGLLARIATDFNPNCIIHLAALVSVPESIEKPEENFRLNIHATRVVGDAAIAARTTRIVFASSAAVYGANTRLPLSEDGDCEPLSPYGEAKLQSERYLLQLAKQTGITVRCQRYFNVYGPRQDPSSPYSGVISRFIDALSKGRVPTVHGDGNQTRDFIYVEDVARSNVLAAISPIAASGVANICTAQGVSLNQLIAEISKITGRKSASIFGPPRTGDVRHSYGISTRAEAELKFVPRWALNKGLESLINRQREP